MDTAPYFYKFGGGVLEKSLRSGAIALVDADWLIQFAEKEKKRLPPRQLLPADAFISFDKFVIEHEPTSFADPDQAHSINRGLKIIALSYMWLDPDHPDPDRTTLRLVAKSLKSFIYQNPLTPFVNNHAWGVFWDYASLYQHPDPQNGIRRNAQQEKLFQQGLRDMPLLYVHRRTKVFRVTKFPPDASNDKSTTTTQSSMPYAQRGWPFVESCWAALVKSDDESTFDISHLSGTQDGADSLMEDCCWDSQAVPLAPESLNRQLQTRSFSNGKTDEEIVQRLYRDTFVEVFRSIEYLDYSNRGWEDLHGGHLVGILGQGSAPLLHTLNLEGNSLGPAFCQAFAGVIPHIQLVELNLSNNPCIGDDGVALLARSLYQLEKLILENVGMTDIGCYQLIPDDSLSKEQQPQWQRVDLTYNQLKSCSSLERIVRLVDSLVMLRVVGNAVQVHDRLRCACEIRNVELVG